MLLHNLNVALVKTRFPENIGMIARACANMGCDEISLVAPERWERSKAEPLATAKGIPVLDRIRVYESLETCLKDAQFVLASSARTGGWRKVIKTPESAAREVADALALGKRVALLFGPEDRGLDNSEIVHAEGIINIKTWGASSLNLAQSALLILYECAKARAAIPEKQTPKINFITVAERALLEKEFREILLQLDCLHGDNPDYFFMQWQGIFNRAYLRRHEFDALMGFCRQIKNKLGA